MCRFVAGVNCAQQECPPAWPNNGSIGELVLAVLAATPGYQFSLTDPATLNRTFGSSQQAEKLVVCDLDDVSSLSLRLLAIGRLS